jgi:hypothetical protein
MSTKRFVTFLFVASFAFAQKFVISTFAGAPPGLVPQPAVGNWIGYPSAAVADGAGDIYFTSLNSVFKVDANGTLTRIAGEWGSGYAGDGGPALQS